LSTNPQLTHRATDIGTAQAVMDARRRQDQYLKELGNLVPTGDPDVDNAWRSGIQREFASAVAEQKAKQAVLDRIVREEQSAAPVDVHLLDLLPMEQVDLLRLDEDHQRRVFDAFHLEMRYNALDRTLKIRVTITGDTAPTLAAAVAAIVRTPENTDEGRGSELVLGPAACDVWMHGVPPAGATEHPHRSSGQPKRSKVEIEGTYTLPTR
jgi:hypothetical protein